MCEASNREIRDRYLRKKERSESKEAPGAGRERARDMKGGTIGKREPRTDLWEKTTEKVKQGLRGKPAVTEFGNRKKNSPSEKVDTETPVRKQTEPGQHL